MKVIETALQGVPQQQLSLPFGSHTYSVHVDASGPVFQCIDPEEEGEGFLLTVVLVKTGESVPELTAFRPRYLGSFDYRHRFHAFYHERDDGR